MLMEMAIEMIDRVVIQALRQELPQLTTVPQGPRQQLPRQNWAGWRRLQKRMIQGPGRV
jgi:hypothetical protein